MNNVIYRFFGVFLMVGLCFLGQSVFADEVEPDPNDGIPDSGIQISPTKFVWTLNDGEVKTGKVVVKNYSDKEQYITMEVEDFFVQADGKSTQLYVPDADHELKSLDVIDWFTAPNATKLAPGESKSVEFTVRVPDGQPTNGYYGSLLFRASDDPGDGDKSRIGISYRIGTLVIMTVQGDQPLETNGEIQEFYSEEDVYWESPVQVVAKIKNTGNIHFPLLGDIEIKKFGKKFHEIKIEPQLLYPTADATFIRERMDFGIWEFGKFDARFVAYSEDKTVQMEGGTSFWIIPWKGSAIIIGSLIGFFIITILFKRYVHIDIGKREKKG
ncbi:MAG: hypothetical protein CR972_02485 [Candidatus Moraniibacteriota bacterium]|nr:MAG: hypothetical protein CR972_02485 [Candidatus Moranbacteria bacterium]